MSVKGIETIHVIPQGTPDWQGDPSDDADPAYDIERCVIIPRYSREDETIVTGYTVFFTRPAGARKIQATDLVEARGETWAVDGVPGDYIGRRGYRATEVKLERAGRQ